MIVYGFNQGKYAENVLITLHAWINFRIYCEWWELFFKVSMRSAKTVQMVRKRHERKHRTPGTLNAIINEFICF